MNNFFYGIVEDRNDPLKIGRVRVRVHGLHTDDKSLIATPDLPWSQVLVPTTSAGLSGFGHGHGLVEGTSVFGMFRDNEKQDFLVLGVSLGINQTGYKETITNELLNRSVEKGFNDPRRLTETDYTSSVDGLESGTDSKRVNSLKLALDKSPQLPESLKINYGPHKDDKSKSEINEPTSKELPYYPIKEYHGKSDLNKFARGEGVYDDRDNLPSGFQPELDRSKTLYPFNKVHHTESGHMIEMDDSVGAERLAVSHRSGTFYEIHKDGTEVHRVVNDNYTVICKDDNVYIGGKCNIKILGDAKLDVGGNADIDVTGKTDILSEGKITITGNNETEIISDTTVTGTLTVSGTTDLKSTLNVTGKQSNSSSITASGEVTGNGVKLSTHRHKYTDSAPSPAVIRTSQKPN